MPSKEPSTERFMKALRSLALAALLLCLSVPSKGTTVPEQGPVDTPSFEQTVSQATLSVFTGQQVCKYTPFETIFGTMQVWGCKFESRFTCTATVIGRESQNVYWGLSAGHCIDWKSENNYFVGSGVDSEPVLHHIKIVKAENDDRYDFAIFKFESLRELPVVAVDLTSGVPAVHTKVMNINFALGVGKHFSTGEVTSEPLNDETLGEKQRFMTNLESAPGASGSAVISLETHKIIGLCEFGFRSGNLGMGVVPMGKRFMDFMDDDTAGIKPLPEPTAVGAASDTEKFLKAIISWFKAH
jgi:hypothetical protein